MSRNLQYLFIVLALFSTAASNQLNSITFVNEPYLIGQAGANTNSVPPQPLPLNHITDTLSDPVVGHQAAHQVGFQLPDFDYNPPGLLRGRQIIITFPSEFDLSTIASVSIFDTDDANPDPQIEWVYVYFHSVVVRLGQDIPGPSAPTFAYVVVDGITSPTVAGDYSVTVTIENRHGQIIAGPNVSEPFSLIPDAPYSLQVSPVNDTTVRAGDGIYFRAYIGDRYGNPISPEEAIWSIDPESDSIGIMDGSFFLARRVGIGRVLARAGDQVARSGWITVVPGSAAGIRLFAGSDSTIAGDGLYADVEVEIIDRFANRATDYAGAVWFSSDDPQAEFVHNQANPYQFTFEDQGYKSFGGNQFIFKTAGRKILTASDGVLADAKEITVYPSYLTDFDYLLPEIIRAGEQFEFRVDNARDRFGNLFTGRISVGGGGIAPNGAVPVISDITVIKGDGAGLFVLVAAGSNHLTFADGGLDREIIIDVLPGDAARLDIEIDGSQFIGHPFRGASHVAAYDAYDNPKTDMSSTDMTFRLTADSGSFKPDVLSSQSFDGNKAGLAQFAYSGPPGFVVLNVSSIAGEPQLMGTADYYANGVHFARSGPDMIPSWVPRTWEFHASGYAVNPSDLTPSKITYRAGFIGGADAPVIISNPECLPLPFSQRGCTFGVTQKVEMAPGAYPYEIAVDAEYELDGETIATAWAVQRDIEVAEFHDLSYEPIDLPDRGYTADYITPVSYLVKNLNTYTADVTFVTELYIGREDTTYRIAGAWFSYSWEPEFLAALGAEFSEDIQPGLYTYKVMTGISILEPSRPIYSVYYRRLVDLGKTVEIVPRALLAVDTASVLPKTVPAGADVAFNLNVDLTGTSEIVLRGDECTLTLSDGMTTSFGVLAQEHYTLGPGSTPLATKPIHIPERWKGKTVSARLYLVGKEADLFLVETEIVFTLPVTIESPSAIQIIAVTNDARNNPFVNTGQSFFISGRIVNWSPLEMHGPIVASLVSDGQSTKPASIVIPVIDGLDTANIQFEVVASAAPNPAEVFTTILSAPDGVLVLPPVDNEAVAIIQLPADLSLGAQIDGNIGSLTVLGYEQQFEIVASVQNTGQSQTDGGKLVLDYSGPGDFGLAFPAEKPLDSVIAWPLTTPNFNIESQFIVDWMEAPIDRNTGEPALIAGGPIDLPFSVRRAETKLAVDASGFSTRPLERGVSGKLFDLTVANLTSDPRNTVALETVSIRFIDRDGSTIDADEIVDTTGTGFYSDGAPVATSRFETGTLLFEFANAVITAGRRVVLECRLMPKAKTTRDYFNVHLDGDMIAAKIVEGPSAGQAVPVSGLVDRPFEINVPQAIIPDEFAASFRNYPNPFNPVLGGTEFRYNLPTASDVDIYIYTETGEKVRHLHYDAGSEGGREGLNADLWWDGRNGNNDMVLNGVYVAYIEVAANGLTATVKLAVVK